MANVFDQFDAPAAQQGNPFDQFDAPPQQTQQPQQAQQPHDKTGVIGGLVRSVAEGVPIVGAAPRYLNALTEAVAAPLLHSDETISHAPSFKQRISENLQRENARSEGFEAEHPIASTAAGLAGGIGAGGALLKTAPTLGARLLGLTGGSPISRVANSALSGAGISAADAALRGNDPTTAAAIGGVVGGAVPVLGRVVGGAVDRAANLVGGPARRAMAEDVAGDVLANRGVAPTASALTDGGPLSTQSLQDVAKAGYDSIDNNGAQIHPDYVNSQIGKIVQDLTDNNFRPIDQPGVFGRLAHLFSGGDEPPPMKFGDIIAARMKMNDIIRKSPGTSKAAAAGQAKEGLDNLLEGLSQHDVVAGDPTQALRALQDANAHYAVMKRAEMYEQAIEKAERQAASSGIGGNFENALRQQFKALRNNKKAMLNVPDDEKAVIDQIIAGTPIQNIARMISRASPTKHTLAGMMEFGTAVAGGEPMAAIAAALAGKLGQATAERMAASRAARLSAMARAKAPASQEVQQQLPPPFSIAAKLAPLGGPLRAGLDDQVGQNY